MRFASVLRCATRALVAPLVVMLATMVSSCTDIQDFDTASGEAFCGNIVPATFVRSGFSPGVSLRLHFHPDSDDSPGDVSTSDEQFHAAPLHALPEIRHDALDRMNLGEGYLHSSMYAVVPQDGMPGLAIVSMLDDGVIELRIIRGVPNSRGAENEGADTYLFGVFLLEKKSGTCGF